MKKNKKLIITLIIIFITCLVGLGIYLKVFNNPNSLNLIEKKWLDDNKTSVISINLYNDLNTFGYNGTGVFYDFIDDFSKEYGLNFNKNALLINQMPTGFGFKIDSVYNQDKLLFYKDHYVVVSKSNNHLKKLSEIKDSKIGTTIEGIEVLTSAYGISSTYTSFESKNTILEALKNDTVNYIIVPLNEYIDVILSEGYNIIYHLSDLQKYYYLEFGDNEVLNSIIKKYYNIWSEINLEKNYYENNYNLFVEKLGLSQIETDTLTNKTYEYGFVIETPYQTLSSSKYGGIVFSYLNEFSKFSKVEFVYNKYKNYSSLITAYNKKTIDLLFNSSNKDVNNYRIGSNIPNNYYIVSPLNDDLFFSNINEVLSQELYVIKDSILYSYLSNINKDFLKTVKNEKVLIKKSLEGKRIAIDANSYKYHINKKIKNTFVVFEGYANENYNFYYINNNDAFYKLFSSYINYLDNNKLLNNGLFDYKNAATSGTIISNLAKYILFTIVFGIIIASIIFLTKKHVKLDTKIRKEDKLKFIDILTSLKNRNYLNEKLTVWNQNTIYPQAVVVLDLNNVKFLNDTYGHEEGDKQITAAANILIKTQLDNSEVMRTDGNEFTIYLVGYNEKQVLNYIRKLVKEFKNLPYEYGAAYGFSMIIDDLKLVDDAISEANIQMRNNKQAIEVEHELQ